MTLGKKNILDEDKYLDDLEYIIKRDFFPDSELLQLQLKYYDAMDAQDFCAVKEIQMKLNRINDTFENNTTAPKTSNSTPKSSSNTIPYKNPSAKESRDLHLNEYLANNTSEDNDSYSELQQKTIERQLQKLSWSFEAAKEYNETRFRAVERKQQLTAIANGTSTATVAPQHPLDSFLDYKVFNPVFFNPGSVALSLQERVSLAGTKSEIVYENTRFKTPLSIVKMRPKASGAPIKSLVPGKIGHDGKELSTGGSGFVAGYAILGHAPDTPDTPEAMTPRTTWGDIDGSPQQIPDSPATVSRFRIQEPSEREKIANEMASKASRSNSRSGKKKEALDRVKSNLNRPNSSARSYVSPAAFRLLSRMTPATPKSSFRSRPGSILLAMGKDTPIDNRGGASGRAELINNRMSITDDLLDI